VSPVEIIGALTGLIAVGLTVRQSAWSWPIGLVSCVAYVFVFFEAAFYSDVILQFYFLATGVVGWWRWARPTDDGGAPLATLPVTRATVGELLVAGAIVGVVVGIWGGAVARNTEAPYPYLDAATMAASLVAQWWMTRKVLESWVIWIVADVVMMGMYATKELHVTAALYAVFTVFAVAGLRAWWRDWAAT
jgi:nicotinamide mononucleotide transporter